MSSKPRSEMLTKAQRLLRIRIETDRLLEKLEKRGKSYVVFPKHLLIAARKP